MAELNIDGETFKVDMAGEATRPAVLLAHALGSDLTMWDGQMEALSRQFRVVRYDARGHGASVRVERPVSLAQLGRDALAIMDALEIETAHFIGVSMGGAVGQWLLINAPHRIDRAVLANTAAKLGTPEMWNTRISAAISGGMTGNADVTIGRWFSPDFVERKAGRVEAIRDVLLGSDPVGYAACCAALRDMDLREALNAIDRPVLVVTGTEDPVNGAEDLALLLGRIEGAAHVALPARHIANIEAEAAFNAAVGDFLTAKRSRPKTPPKPARASPLSTSRAARQPVARRAGDAARSPLRQTIKDPTPLKSISAKPDDARAASKSGESSRRKVGPKGAKTPSRTAASKAKTAPTRAKAAGKAEDTKAGRGSAKSQKAIAGTRRTTPKPAATASKLKAAVKKTASPKTTAVKTSAVKAGAAKTGKAKASAAKERTAKVSAAKASRAKASTAKASSSKAGPPKSTAPKSAAPKSAAPKSAPAKSGASAARPDPRKGGAAKPVAAKAFRQPVAKTAKAISAPKKVALARGGAKSAASPPVPRKSRGKVSPVESRKPTGTPRRAGGRNRT